MIRNVIIVAGGKGTRMGGDLPKQFLPLCGKPIIMHTLEAFYRWDAGARLIVAIPEAFHDYWNMLCRELNCTVPHQTVGGGETRTLSVQNALREIDSSSEGDNTCEQLVAIHDGVRPFISPAVVSACFEAAGAFGAAIPVVRMIDSVREMTDETNSRTADRDRLRIVQTPQVFWLSLLKKAYGAAEAEAGSFTDDASLIESVVRHTVHLVEGNRENIKITTPADLRLAEFLFNHKSVLP